MVRAETTLGRLVVMLTAVALALGLAVTPGASPPAEAATKTPIMQKSRLTPAQIAGWFHANTPGGYRASVPVEFLAAYFVFEGDAEGVSGDIAFAQSIVETGWFRYQTGQVKPSYNNYGGIGACDGGTCTVARFRSARIGVRAQIQHLRAYADKNVTATNLAYPLESPRFHLVTPKGKAPNWQDLGNGAWATDKDYSQKVLNVYASMRDFAKKNPQLQGRWLFSDVAEGTRFEGDIIHIAVAGVTQGCGGDRYCPRDFVTRDQMASFLVRARGLKLTNKNYFTDIGDNSHRRAINTLREHGITLGCNPPKNDRFCPRDEVTREQMASFIARARGLTPVNKNAFKDIGNSGGHRGNINALAAEKITNGCGSGNYCPRDLVTRQQMAGFLNRGFL